MLYNFMKKFAHFLKNCWTVLCIKFFKLPHLYNAIIDNVLVVHFLSGHSVYVYAQWITPAPPAVDLAKNWMF